MADRRLGFGVTEGTIGYELAFAAAKHAGLQFVELPQQWDEVETSEGVFSSEFAAIADEVYPALDTEVVLSLNPIDTTARRVPKHFDGFAWDDPRLIDGFCRWVDWTLNQLPHATVPAISVGNEVDGYLSARPEEIEAYAAFFAAVADRVRREHPAIELGCKMTFAGRTGPIADRLTTIDRGADAVMVTYYPLDDSFTVRKPSVVADDFATMVDLAGDRPVHILEAGYPSGSTCGSSPAKQAAFVDALFDAWDRHVDAVRRVNLVWTCDLPSDQVDAMTSYYNVDSPAFADYLATLGMRTADGRDKPAWTRVRAAVAERAK